MSTAHTALPTTESNDGMTVTYAKFTEGVKTVFMGVLEILSSIQPHVAHELVDAFIPKESPPAPVTTELSPSPEPRPAPQAPEPPVVSVTLDDITKVIVAKIKQKRSNNEAIGKLLGVYKVQKVSELKPEQYEAFMTDLAQI